MHPWTCPPAPRCPKSTRLTAVRDVAIIAVCVAILAFAFLVVWGAPRDAEAARRSAASAPASVDL